ncbi:MAG TPA: glycosyltransferase family 39 protein [Candidatus Kapabacteria bacterium]|nr:glycosyltransferase family 39 protein [Candidatus Kapabacteria bacterium]
MVLKHGAIPYRDFLDTKPPLIFYLYALSSLLFGHHEWSIRIFDLLYQLAASIYFFKILTRYFHSRTAALTVCITILIYAGTGFWHTAQVESFAFIPSLLLLDVTLRAKEPNRSNIFTFGLFAGIASAVLFLLKFTLITGTFASVIFILLRKKNESNTALRYSLGLITSFVILLVGYILYLKFTGSLEYFLQNIRWVSNYAQIEPLLGRDTIATQYFTLFPERLISTMTLSFFVLGCAGIAVYLRNLSRDHSQPIHGLLALTWGLQLIGVLAERKMFQYQYLRATWTFAPFIAMGIFYTLPISKKIWERLSQSKIPARTIGSMLFMVIVLIAFFYSPFIKLFSQSIPWVHIVIADENAGVEVHKRIPDYYADEQMSVGKYLKQRAAGNDNIFVWGNDMAIYYYANKLPSTLCLTATPLRTPWTPPAWQDTLIKQMIASPPRFFISEFGDVKSYITGSTEDSYQALLKWSALRDFLASNYEEDTTIGHYKIFRMK